VDARGAEPVRLEETLAHVSEVLDPVPAVGLFSGAALYLLGHVAFLFRTTGRVFPPADDRRAGA
jgi:hypothetical protein